MLSTLTLVPTPKSLDIGPPPLVCFCYSDPNTRKQKKKTFIESDLKF